MVLFRCRLTDSTRPLPHFWEHTVGSCHAPLALRADWQNQLRRCHEELGLRRVRFHGLLCDDVGTVVSSNGRLMYSFFNADQIVDFLLSMGMEPFVELSFMPEALASKPTTVFHYRANISPPRHFGQWAALIRKLVSHWVDRYGVEKVRDWFFEVWNEPNLKQFWSGTQQDYFELYRHSVAAIKEVDSQIKVGGPATAKNAWIDEFLDFGEKNHLAVDFVSTHHYPNDVAAGDALPQETDDADMQLAHSPRSIMQTWAREAKRQARGRPLLYTEWNISSNPRFARQDEPFTAAFIIKTVLEANGLVDGYSFWTFSDIFEENYFPSVPFHGGFGLLNLHGIPKPSYRAFQILHRLGTEQLPVEGRHDTVDAWVARDKTSLAVILTNHNVPRRPIRSEKVQVELVDALEPRRAFVERIDDGHASPKHLWFEMGQPEYLSREQVERLQAASELTREAQPWRYEDRTVHLEMELPAYGVAVITLEF